jgi:3-oxoadipate enol-lactonase
VTATDEPTSPTLPPGRDIELADRGAVFVRHIVGPPGAPTIFLLHGWTATADLNFFTAYAPLAEHFGVVAYDHRGHGRGLRTRRSFRLEDCADDAVAVADALGIERFVPVGYSMGGPIAQLVWRRHAARVIGLVLCATAARFNGPQQRWTFLGLTGLARLARLTPAQARVWITEQLYLQRKTAEWEPWAIEEASRHEWRMILEAGSSLGRFSSLEWLGEIDVPTGVVLTMGDSVVPVARQVELFEAIPQARAWRVDGAHDAVIANPERFAPTLVEACEHVVS